VRLIFLIRSPATSRIINEASDDNKDYGTLGRLATRLPEIQMSLDHSWKMAVNSSEAKMNSTQNS